MIYSNAGTAIFCVKNGLVGDYVYLCIFANIIDNAKMLLYNAKDD